MSLPDVDEKADAWSSLCTTSQPGFSEPFTTCIVHKCATKKSLMLEDVGDKLGCTESQALIGRVLF